MMWRRRLLWAMASFGLLAACTSDREPALRIGGNIWPGYEPMYVAKVNGYYDPKQIHLIDFPSAVEVARAYRNGVIDVAALTGDELLTIAAAEPDKHKIILVSDFSNGADCILAQPSFTTFVQLRGRRVGVEVNAVGGYVLQRALQLNGMTIHDVTPVALMLEEHVQAFESGAVDAVVTFEPTRSTLLASGALEVFTSKALPGEIVDVVIARDELVRSRAPALTHFVQGWFKGLDYINRQPLDAAAVTAIHEQTSAQSFLASLEGLQLVDRTGNLRLLGKDTKEIETALAKLAATMANSGLLSREFDVRGLADGSIVEQAVP